MKRTKPPVLTSPSKIGFFVSLMLVSVSIGVAYFYSRRFGVSWDLLGRDWLNRNEWLGIVRGEGFLFEMLPLVGLVAVVSMFAYLVITGAVRKYKRYLDSGCDYRNLLSSLKDLEDLEDKRKIERIKNHPELKRLLLGLAETIEERDRQLGEREGALEARLEEALQSKESELAERFAQECERLARAVESGTLEPSAIEFSNPGLRALGEAAGRALRGAEQAPEPGLAESYGDLRKTSDVLHAKLAEIADELKTGCESAQQIEAHVRVLVGADEGDPGHSRLEAVRNETRKIVSGLKALEQINITVDALSEEAKGIAINTALHAGSGMGTQDDLIRLAEEVKEVAARFKDTAKRFAQTSSAVRASMGVLDAIAGEPVDRLGRAARPDETLAGVLSRVSLWVERVVVLSDKVSNLAQSYDVSVSALPATSGKRTAESAEPEEAAFQEPAFEEPASEAPAFEEPAESEEFGFESLDRSRALFQDVPEPPAEEPEAPEAPPRPMERGILEDLTSRIGRSFETARAEAEAGEWMSAEDEERPGDAERALRDAVRDERDVESEEAPATAPDEPEEAPAETAQAEEDTAADASTPDEETVDLYALGAIDYDPALHG